MKHLSLLTLLFAILTLVFVILLVLFRSAFPPYRLVSYQDVFDVLTPLVLIPVYWLLFRYSTGNSPSSAEEIVFIAFAALWVEGHSMHLSANSINNLIEHLARGNIVDIRNTEIYQLTYFFDEHLSHLLWHLGMLGLATLLIYREWNKPAGTNTVWWQVLLAGFIYGFSFFAIFLEGQTVFLGLPFATLVMSLLFIRRRSTFSERPVLAFFFAAFLFAFILFAIWGVYWRGFPQFSDVGLI